MRARSGRTAMVAGILMGTIGLGASAGAQMVRVVPSEERDLHVQVLRSAQDDKASAADSAPHFALFGGWAPFQGGMGDERGFAMGGSGDFRLSPIPVPLRLSLSFDERASNYSSTQRGGQASLELVMRPIPKLFGVRPYFLGGLGVATQMGHAEYFNFTSTTASYVVRPRQTWAFASAGMGLDIGRAFIQMKLAQPIASDGPVLVPISVGFRFWD